MLQKPIHCFFWGDARVTLDTKWRMQKLPRRATIIPTFRGHRLCGFHGGPVRLAAFRFGGGVPGGCRLTTVDPMTDSHGTNGKKLPIHEWLIFMGSM